MKDELATRIPVEDVGESPPGVGVLEYINAKSLISSTEDWYACISLFRTYNKRKQMYTGGNTMSIIYRMGGVLRSAMVGTHRSAKGLCCPVLLQLKMWTLYNVFGICF